MLRVFFLELRNKKNATAHKTWHTQKKQTEHAGRREPKDDWINKKEKQTKQRWDRQKKNLANPDKMLLNV